MLFEIIYATKLFQTSIYTFSVFRKENMSMLDKEGEAKWSKYKPVFLQNDVQRSHEELFHATKLDVVRKILKNLCQLQKKKKKKMMMSMARRRTTADDKVCRDLPRSDFF